MSKVSVSHRKKLIEELKQDEEFQIEYLKVALEENFDMPEAFLLAIKTIAEARGFSRFAENAGLSRESLYKTLSKNGNPKLETVFKLLNSMGLRLSVETVEKKKAG